jgi:hypothetical protein
MRGALHNDVREDSHRKCTFRELQNAIEWYKMTIRKYQDTKMARGLLVSCRNNLAILEAERANRFNRALDLYYERRRRNRKGRKLVLA